MHCSTHPVALFSVYIIALSFGLVSGFNDVCHADGSSSYTFVVSLNISRTGRRIVTVNTQHATPFHVEEDDAGMQITHSSRSCGKIEHIELTTTAILSEYKRPKVPDYEFFPGVGYYKLHTQSRTWDDARATCLEEGAHLLVINSEKEADVVKTFLARNPVFKNTNDPLYGAYVGITDRDQEGRFVTVTGGLIEHTGYTKWAPGEPKDDRGQNYIAVEKDALFHDIVNGRRMGFICEVE